MGTYYLMNKNKRIALLECIDDSLYIKELYTDKLPIIIDNIDTWIFERSAIVGRANLINMAKLAGISNREAFLEISKAISVTDTFWIDSTKNSTTWDKISPYSNRISRIMADIAIDGVYLYKNQNLASPSPQYRIGGSVDKCIKRIEGKQGLYLFKTNGELWHEVMAVRPYSEYFVSKLIDTLDINIAKVSYGIKENKTENGYIKPYTYCKLFTSEKYGLIEYCDSRYRHTSLEDLLRIFKNSNNIKNYSLLRDMLIIDSITLNPDRHTGNYGFIIDNDDFSIKQMAPIYDNDCALGSIISIQDKSFEDAFNELKNNHLPKTELGDYDEQALMVMNKTWYNKLKSIKNIKLTKENINGITDRRLDFINYMINRRIKEIVNLVEETYHLK